MTTKSNQKLTLLPQAISARNTGVDLDLDWVSSIQANTSAIERRASSIGSRRSVKKQHQAAWLLQAIKCMDLTTLSGDDTIGRVKRLCAKAKTPISNALLENLGLDDIKVGAVCVYHDMIEAAVAKLSGTGIHRLSCWIVAITTSHC